MSSGEETRRHARRAIVAAGANRGHRRRELRASWTSITNGQRRRRRLHIRSSKPTWLVCGLRINLDDKNGNSALVGLRVAFNDGFEAESIDAKAGVPNSICGEGRFAFACAGQLPKSVIETSGLRVSANNRRRFEERGAHGARRRVAAAAERSGGTGGRRGAISCRAGTTGRQVAADLHQ